MIADRSSLPHDTILRKKSCQLTETSCLLPQESAPLRRLFRLQAESGTISNQAAFNLSITLPLALRTFLLLGVMTGLEQY
ncbi:unnamed protein product [Gongylonema pulchrum]|uniref:Uncharacterized protein n=1 Tax=Gongylonema pulchrum TaxID=637853 RepID=A0A183DNI2_9BILA|nr:unnamed protein product [Gongylonema pulchrum]